MPVEYVGQINITSQRLALPSHPPVKSKRKKTPPTQRHLWGSTSIVVLGSYKSLPIGAHAHSAPVVKASPVLGCLDAIILSPQDSRRTVDGDSFTSVGIDSHIPPGAISKCRLRGPCTPAVWVCVCFGKEKGKKK